MEQTPADRERDADERDRLADERDRVADERDERADQRERAADERDRSAGTGVKVDAQPVSGKFEDDRFGINLGPSTPRTVASDTDETPSAKPSPRTLTERLEAAAVDRDDSDTPND